MSDASPLIDLSAALRAGHDALRRRQQGPFAWAQPVAVVGPREATPAQEACARRIGALLGSARMPVLCGGKSGVMAAVSAGVSGTGGLVIGLLPEEDTRQANPHLTVALPTGLGITRNAPIAIISRAAVWAPPRRWRWRCNGASRCSRSTMPPTSLADGASTTSRR